MDADDFYRFPVFIYMLPCYAALFALIVAALATVVNVAIAAKRSGTRSHETLCLAALVGIVLLIVFMTSLAVLVARN